MRLTWSANAVSDLKAISDYIEHDRSLKTANRIARRIYDTVQGLRTMPYRGRFGRIEGTQELVLAGLPYVVIYRPLAEQVLILGIVHGARKLP